MCIEKLGPKGKEAQVHDIAIYHQVTYEKYSRMQQMMKQGAKAIRRQKCNITGNGGGLEKGIGDMIGTDTGNASASWD